MKDPLKPRDKVTQKMSRDGLIEVNETKETAERISRREQETDYTKQPEQPQDMAQQLHNQTSETAPLPPTPGIAPKHDTVTAERVMEHIGAAQSLFLSLPVAHYLNVCAAFNARGDYIHKALSVRLRARALYFHIARILAHGKRKGACRAHVKSHCICYCQLF